MKRFTIIAVSGLLCFMPGKTEGQDKVWTLRQCLDYALENNIQLQQANNTLQSGIEDAKEAKAALFPSISASTSQNFVNYPSSDAQTNNTYSGNYGIDATLPLYQGGKLRTAVKQQELQNRIDELSVRETENDIRESIVTAYMQILYAKEAVNVAESTAEASKQQRDRAEEMWKAGSLSKVDFAQLESQYASDKYQIVTAKSSLDNYKLQLKQLLELEITDEIDVADPQDGDDEILASLPEKTYIYAKALESMPDIQKGELDVEAAELAVRQAKSGFYPTAALSAGIGTGHISGGGSLQDQLWNRFNESAGLNINIPILSGRQNRTAVSKANISLQNSRLEQKSTEKEILKKVESAYLDALSSQSQYTSASEKEDYARESYELVSEQFRVGSKNTVELITAQSELFSASQEKLQAKYMALLSLKLLDIYQGNADNL